VRPNFGHEFLISKQENISISTSVRKHLICELQLKECQQQFNINVRAGIAGDCLAGPHVLPHHLKGNHYRDFLLHDLPEILGYVPLAAEHNCDTCMMMLRHILAVLCEMFSVTAIMTDG
jgi:hypothetical protein